MAMQIMVSYARRVDTKFVYELANILHNTPGFAVWIDRAQLVGGTNWWAEICEAVENADCVVVFLTKRYLESIYCLEELDYALALNKPVLPLMLEEVPYPKNISEKQIQDIRDLSLETTLLRCSLSFNAIQGDIYAGKYPQPNPLPQRPPVPQPPAPPTRKPADLLVAASTALNQGNLAEAKKLLNEVLTVDAARYGKQANIFLQEITHEEERAEEYEALVNALRTAITPMAKRVANGIKEAYIEKFGFEPDPLGILGDNNNPLPPINPTSAQKPPAQAPSPSFGEGVGGEVKPPDPDYVTRLRNFSGKKNADWQPFIGVFKDLKIPDMEFCLVPGGTFQMGSDDGHYKDEQPVHPQTVKPYWIARYPVTNAQWRLAVAAKAVVEPQDDTALKWYNEKTMADAPVVGVSWLETQKFCEWLGVRLPTEPEWEFAARGVDNLRYPWSNDWNENIPVWSKTSGGKPSAVTSKPEGKSWVGAQHLIGNVWEWCSSLYLPYPYAANKTEINSDKTNRRVLRGGSWWDNRTGFLRAACRGWYYPDDFNNIRGFRCVRSY